MVLPDDRLTAGRILGGALARHRGRIAVGVALLCLHQAAEALVPVAIGVTIDRAVATGDRLALLWSVLGMALLFTVLALAYRFGSRQAVIAIEREAHLLRVRVAARALDPRGQRTGLRSGELLAIASSDAERSALIIRAGSVGMAALTALAVSSVALLTIDVPLGLGVLVGVPLLVLALQGLAPLLTRREDARQAAAAGTTALATDLVNGLRAVRGIGAQDNAVRRYETSSRQTLTVTLRAATMNGVYQGITTAASGLFLAAVAAVAGWLALRGRLSIGEFVAVVGLAQFIAEPVQTLGYCGQVAAAARASAGRVAGVLAAPAVLESGDRPLPAPSRTRLALEQVSYRTLTEVELRLAAGELLGVLALDPRDGDALLALLAGPVAADEYTGRLLIDDVPAESLDLAERRRAVLVEQHEVALFEGTLRTNLVTDGASGSPDRVVAAALRAAAVEELVAGLPAGLEHPVTDRGATLSGGQRQRLGLARALAAGAPVLVLHDPTTAVDAVTEEQVAEGLTGLRTGQPDSATLVLSSSPALLSRMHRVVVLDSGRVAAVGHHDQLIRTDSRYREAVRR
ncbi:ABC transporter ATP-binding protein [Solwaraspora sp. WMMD1047]|uniref:ABC transporter transmembrane domain-containing protein n=1 Tax=Solwaraspora sp. WMMD1047 TaxID=3016102 RepID=UPI002417C380|nr:ABC transporter ATP-binding protein [Solwaraspora sp. WMMD1047]MDG4830879.1 ABC transporter ATP-binding protein [Solwaraspora sp. WMMD1047]